MKTLAVTIGVLMLLSAATQFAKFYLGHPTVFGLVRLFNVDLEANLPTWFQSLQLLICSLLLGAIAVATRRAGRAFALHWLALAGVFLLLSVDESAKLHESTIEPLQRFIERPSGIWTATWVLLALPAVGVLAVAYIRFLLHLKGRERAQVVIAAALFLGGAVGVEMATGLIFREGYKETIEYTLLAHLEELLEMAGMLLFIDFLLQRLPQAGHFVVTMADK